MARNEFYVGLFVVLAAFLTQLFDVCEGTVVKVCVRVQTVSRTHRGQRYRVRGAEEIAPKWIELVNKHR